MAGGAKVWIERGKGNDKAAALTAYVSKLSAQLASPVPEKHRARPEAYHEFLRREIASHSKKIEALKLAEPPKK